MLHADRRRLLLRTPGFVQLGTCICSTCCDQSFSRTYRYFSGQCSSNLPRYFLDFAVLSQFLEVRTAILFFRSAKENPTNLVDDLDFFSSFQVLANSVQRFREEIENVSDNQEAMSTILFFDRPKNRTLVEDLKVFIPVMFGLFPFSNFLE